MRDEPFGLQKINPDIRRMCDGVGMRDEFDISGTKTKHSASTNKVSHNRFGSGYPKNMTKILTGFRVRNQNSNDRIRTSSFVI